MDQPNAAALLYQAATFAERGVSVPFTTPVLQGARTRRDPRVGLELVVPNPSGGRGVYVLPWAGVRELCQPTVHDTRLHEVLMQAGPVTPRSMRTAARQVAMDGSAGRGPRAAAQQAQQAEAESQQATNRFLLDALGGQPAAGVTEMAALSTLLDEVGIGPRAQQAAMPVRLARLNTLHDGIEGLADPKGDDWAKLAAGLLPLIKPTIQCASMLLAEARDAAVDVSGLIALWRAGPDRLHGLAARPDWVLDGWDLPCLLWQEASDDVARRARLTEIFQVAPVLPKEASQWATLVIDLQAAQAVRRTVSLNQDWRTGLNALDRVARNEHMLALAS